MQIEFRCLQEGKRFYGVVRQGREVFAGTREECNRYLALHHEKLAQERTDDRRPFRHAPFQVRTYRVATPRVG